MPFRRWAYDILEEKGKKEKKLLAAKSGLVDIKGILRYLTVWNIFAVFFECDLFHAWALQGGQGEAMPLRIFTTLT